LKIVTQIICYVTSKEGNNISLIVDPTLILHPCTDCYYCSNTISLCHLLSM